MAGQQPDQWEKTEDATPQKKKEAKNKGTVAKSQDINALLALTVSLIVFFALGESLAYSMLDVCRQLFIDANLQLKSVTQYMHWFETSLQSGIWVAMPVVASLILVGVTINLLQVGGVFTFFPLKPDLKRINPVDGFKRLFSMKLMFESVKTFVKVGLFFAILYQFMVMMIPLVPSLAHSAPQKLLPYLISYAGILIFSLILAFAFIALIDHLFVRWEYQRNLKMTKKELKDEIKRREGDPHIKSKRRELEQELRRRSRSLSSVKDADVIITNPEHYAVVVKYKKQTMPAPKVVGKGMDQMALAIREEGRKCGVPIIQSPALARRLFQKAKTDQYIPQDTFLLVAKVLRQVYQQRMKNSERLGVV